MISEALAERCVKRKTLPREVVEYCKTLILDFLGIAVRASELRSSKSLFSALKNIAGDGICTAITHKETFPPQYAALINGVYGHSLDFDDTHRESSIHPGVSVIPAALAMGEIYDANGKNVIEAIVAGYDVACKLGIAINPKEHYARGFHGTGTCGVFGATAAAGVVAELSYEEFLNAFGINISQVCGSMQFLENGSWNKRFHPGFAAHNAIIAVYMAKNGFKGAAKPIEGKYGFLKAYSDNADPSKVDFDRYEILRTGIKPYPCCRYIHPAVDLVLDNRIDDFDEMVVEMTTAGYRIVGEPIEKKREPKNVVDAQFSMPFALAVAIKKGRLTVDDFSEETLKDEEIKRLMKKINVVPNENLDKFYPEKWPVIVRVDSVVLEKYYPKGEPEDPLKFEEVAEKFRSLVGNKVQAENVIDAVKNFDRIEVSELTELLRMR